jgi:hypothetical protein
MSTDSLPVIAATTLPCAKGDSPEVATPKSVADLIAIAEILSPNDRLRLIAAVWGSLPPSHPSAPSAKQLSELQGCLANCDEDCTKEFPWATVAQLMSGEQPENITRIYSVPRRFDLSTIFVVTLAYSLLFGLMSIATFPPVASLSIGGFITLIAISQAVLFEGKRPRTASLIVGSLMFGAAVLALWFANGQRIYPAAVFAIVGGYTIAAGAMLGYLSGTIVGGIFLIADKCRNRFGRNHGVRSDGNPKSGICIASESDSPWAT